MTPTPWPTRARTATYLDLDTGFFFPRAQRRLDRAIPLRTHLHQRLEGVIDRRPHCAGHAAGSIGVPLALSTAPPKLAHPAVFVRIGVAEKVVVDQHQRGDQLLRRNHRPRRADGLGRKNVANHEHYLDAPPPQLCVSRIGLDFFSPFISPPHTPTPYPQPGLGVTLERESMSRSHKRMISGREVWRSHCDQIPAPIASALRMTPIPVDPPTMGA